MNQEERTSPGFFLLIVVLVALVAVLVWRRMQPAKTVPHPLVGKKLTAFAVEPLTEGSRKIQLDDLSGKVTLINFWGPWCHYCKLEFPHLMKLRKEFSKHSRFESLFVSCSAQIGGDLNRLERETRQYLTKKDLDLPVYSDPLARARLMLESEGVKPFGYPTTLILDGDGIIRGLWAGYSDNNAAEMRQILEQLVSDNN